MRICIIGLMIALIGSVETPAPMQATSRPTTQSAPSSQKTTYRRPVQAEVLREMIREREERKPIQPISNPRTGESATSRPSVPGLIPEGNVLIEKTGRLIRETQGTFFEFDTISANGEHLKLELHKCLLLEQMELAAKGGTTAFSITAEVFSYQGKNYLLLKKVNTHLNNGNVSP